MALNGWEIQLLNTAGVKQAVLWNPNSQTDAVGCVVQEEVEGKDEITFVTADLEHRAIFQNAGTTYTLRVVNLQDPTIYRTYDIDNTALIHEGDQERIEVKGQRLWVRLKTRYLYNETRTYTEIGIGALILEILNTSGANTEFQLGTIDSNTETVDSFEVNNEFVLGLFRRLCAKMGRELTIDEATSPKMALSFLTSQGDSSSSARMIYGVNAPGVQRMVDKTEMVTRMFGTGGGTPAVKLSASALAGGNDFIDDGDFDASTHNYVGHYQNTDILDITNLIADASEPDLSGTYTGGVCAGWTKIGTPTCTEVLATNEPTVVEHGTKAMRVVAAVNEGVFVAFVANTSLDQTAWVNISIEALTGAGGVKIELSDGTVRRVNGSGWFDLGDLTKFELRGFRTPDSTSGTMKITAVDNGATFVVDAAMVQVGTEFTRFIKGDWVDVLYGETADELAKVNNARTTYAVRAIDLYPTDPKKWAAYEFGLGDTVKVEDQKVGIEVSQRIIERTWNIMEPRMSGFKVGDAVDRLGNIIVRQDKRTRTNVEVARTAQVVASVSSGQVALERPLNTLRVRVDVTFTSDSSTGFTYDAGSLFVGDLEFDLAGATISGLTLDTVYYCYFDLDAAASDLQVTTTYATSIGPRLVSVASIETGISGDAGMMIIPFDGRPQISGNDVISGTIDSEKAAVQRTGASSAKVALNANGIEGFNAAGTRTTFIDVDGSGQLGATGSTPMTWDANGLLSVPGGIVTTGIAADNITSGTLTIGASPSAAERITMAYATEDIVIFRGGSAVVDLGDITESGFEDDTGLRITDPNGTVQVNKTGVANDVAGFATAFLAITSRGVDEGNTTGEFGFATSMNSAAQTSGQNGTMVGFLAGLTNQDGDARGFDANSVISSTDDAFGFYVTTVTAASGTAYGLYVSSGISGGSVFGIYVADTAAINFLGGILRLNNSTVGAPTNAVDIGSVDLTAGNTMLSISTEGGGAVGSGTPTQDRTFAIDINGTTYHILMSTAAS